MKVNCYNSFDKLEEMVLGRVDLSVLDNIPNQNKKAIMHDVLLQTESDLENISKILEDWGVKVHRPICKGVDFSKTYQTPFFDLSGIHIPLCPRDNIWIAGDEICLTSSGDRSRLFDSVFYKNIFDYYDDSHIFSMPMPMLHDDLYIEEGEIIDDSIKNSIEYFKDHEPLLDAANIQMYGKDIFVTNRVTSNKKGIKWLQNYCDKNNYRLHALGSPYYGHIDTFFNIIRPGLILSYFSKEYLPDYFKNWTVITPDPDPVVSDLKRELITENVQDDDFNVNELSCNIITLDQNTVLIYEWLKDSEMIKKLEKNKIDVVLAPLKYCHFINQGLKCITLETVRQGTLEDYTT